MNTIQLVGVIASSQIRIDEYPGKEAGEIKVKASFLLGVRRAGTDRKGDLIRVETWGTQARNLVRFNGFKSRIAITGRLRSEFYNPDGVPKGGQLRSCVVAERIEYLTPKSEAQQESDAGAEAEPVKAAAGGRR